MLDYQAECERAVGRALQRLRSHGDAKSFTDRDDGITIKGWELPDYYRRNGPFHDGPWEESSDIFQVLAEDGTLWERHDHSRALQETPWTFERRDILIPVSQSELVGTVGSPFSEWMERVERLGY